MSFCLVVLVGCNPPRVHEYANLTASGSDLPHIGTSAAALDKWFDENAFAPGSRVWQAESELRRTPGTPWVYAEESERSWWLTRVKTLRHFCMTQKFIYYKLGDDQALSHAIMTARSQC